MKYIKFENGWLLRLEKGEKLVEKITEFADAKKIKTAWFFGIGALKSAEIAFYHLDKKEFATKKINYPTEVVSLSGNITRFDKKPAIHAHIVLSDDKFKTLAGHLNEAVIGATLEIIIWDLKKDIKRLYNEEIGLKLLDF